jgi:hypothetical protein
MVRLALMCRRSESGSISAPARKVSKPEPNVARKSIQGVVCRPAKLPPRMPKPISMSATETPTRIDTRLAASAIAIHAAAIR